MSTGHGIVEFFARHLVSFGFVTNAPGPGGVALGDGRKLVSVSGFVLDYDNVWMLVVAGHVMQDVISLLDAGHTMTDCRLVDGWNWKAKDERVIPFAFLRDMVDWKCSNDGYDIGLIPITDNPRALLKANGVIPVDRSIWSTIPNNLERHFMLGLPSYAKQRIGYGSNARILVRPELIRLAHLLDPPQEVQTASSLWYGRVGGDVDIDGWSGGPVIGVRREPDSRMRYWIVAVQSGWYRDRRINYAVPIDRVIARIEAAILQYQRERLSAT